MEYIIRSDKPFDEIETLTIAALERQGLTVQRTFSLHSAIGIESAVNGCASGSPGYSVLMLHATGAGGGPLGLLTLYQRGGRIVIVPALTTPPVKDVEADLVAALVLGDLEFCLGVAGAERCVGSRLKDGKEGAKDE